MRPLLALPLVLLVTGCIGPAASLTTHGAIVGADDSSAAFLGTSGTASTFLAVPRDLSDLESNIVEDAEQVTVEQAGASVELVHEGGGVYSSSAGVPYVPDATYSLRAVVDGESHRVSVEAPEGPDLTFGAAHLAGSPLVVDLEGQGYDHAFAFVVDERGDTTWDSRPTSDAELIEELRDADGIDVLHIPATAFPLGGGTYVVAVGGFVKAKGSDYDGFGAILSTFAAGKFTGAGLSVR